MRDVRPATDIKLKVVGGNGLSLNRVMGSVFLLLRFSLSSLVSPSLQAYSRQHNRLV